MQEPLPGAPGFPEEPAYPGRVMFETAFEPDPALPRHSEEEMHLPLYDAFSKQSISRTSSPFGMAQPESVADFEVDPGMEWLARQRPPEGGTKQRVKLRGGHWIVDYPVPSPVKNAVEPHFREQGQPSEFTHMRYAAVT